MEFHPSVNVPQKRTRTSVVRHKSKLSETGLHKQVHKLHGRNGVTEIGESFVYQNPHCETGLFLSSGALTDRKVRPTRDHLITPHFVTGKHAGPTAARDKPTSF